MNRLTRAPDFVAYAIKPYWTERNIFACALIMSWVKYLWYRYLSYIQCKVVKSTQQVPPELADITDQETFSNARLYQLDKMEFGFYRGIWDMLLTTVLLHSGGICFVWRYCEELADRFGALNNELMATCLYLFVGSLASALFGLPWSIYYTFVIEQRHGFNKQGQVITLPLACGIVQIVKMGGSYFFVSLWLFSLAVSAFISFICMDYIAPLFDKLTPLPEGKLKTEIGWRALAIKKAHSRIGCSDDQILGILAHELGHWKHAHVTKMFIIRQIYAFLSCMAISKLLDDDRVYRAFGFDKSKPIFIGLNLILGFILSPCNAFVSVLMTVLGRHFEFQADSFARRMHHASSLRGALIKINRDNLSFPVYDWLYSTWRNSHPPVLERVHELDKID